MASASSNPTPEIDTYDSIKDCSICNEEYDEDQRCPRNLQCSHCLCTECIARLINRNEKQCPFCRRGFEAQSAKDLEKNAFALDLLKYIKELEAEKGSPVKASPKSRSKLVDGMRTNSKAMNNQNLAAFRIAENSIKTNMKTNEELKRTIMENHQKIQGDLMNRINDMKERCQLDVKYLENENVGLEKQLQEIQQKVKELEKVKADLEAATTLVKVDSVIDKVEASNTAIKPWIQGFKINLSRREKIIECLQKRVKATEERITSMMKLLTSIHEGSLELNFQLTAERLQGRIQSKRMNAESTKSKATLPKKMLAAFNEEFSEPWDLKNMTPEKKQHLSTRGFYAVEKHLWKTRTAKLSFSEGKILLHCFRDCGAPLNAYTIEFCELMKLVDPESRHAFLEFGSASSTLGLVYIALTPNTTRAQNFALLCSGERGISYKDTSILKVVNKDRSGEWVECGITNLDMGLIPGTDIERDGVLRRRWLAGTVIGYYGTKNSGRFNIITRGEPLNIAHNAFGEIEEGLHVITDVISDIPNISEVKVVNCGLVFPL